jgi:hypothetical protein
MSKIKNNKFVLCLVSGCILFAVNAAELKVKKKVDGFQYGKQTSGFVLSIKTKVKNIESEGYIVYAIVRIKNASTKNLEIIQTSPISQYFFEVTDPSGKKIPRLLFQKKLDKMETGSFNRVHFYPLKPGEFVEHKFNLSQRFDFSLQGDYLVTSYRKLMLHDRISKKLLIKKVYSPKLKFSIK